MPDPQEFTYELGDVVSNGQVGVDKPAVGAGNLETIASIDRYLFTVPAGGMNVQYERLSGFVNVSVFNAAGTKVAGNGYQNWQADLSAGECGVVVGPRGRALRRLICTHIKPAGR